MNDDTNPNHYIRAKMNGLYSTIAETNRQIILLRDQCKHEMTKKRHSSLSTYEEVCAYCDKHIETKDMLPGEKYDFDI